MEDESIDDNFDSRSFETGHDPIDKGRVFLFDITLFTSLLKLCFAEIGVRQKRAAIKKIIGFFPMDLIIS